MSHMKMSLTQFEQSKRMDALSVNGRGPDLVQGNHRVGDSKDEVDVVL